jgi:hypothetical protein
MEEGCEVARRRGYTRRIPDNPVPAVERELRADGIKVSPARVPDFR